MEDSIEDQIVSLRSELKAYGADIVNHISTLYSSNSSAIDLRNDPRNMLKILKHDISQLLQEVQAESQYNEENASAIKECETLAASLDTIAIASTAIAQCSETIMGDDVMAGCNSVFHIENLMKSIPSENSSHGSGAVCDMLRREAKLLRTRFLSRLARLLQDCIHISRGRVSVSKELSGVLRSEDSLLNSAVRLMDIWEALALMGDNKLHAVVGKIVADLWKDIFSPLWKEKKAQSPKIVTGDTQSEVLIDFQSNEVSHIESEQGEHLTVSHTSCILYFPPSILSAL